MVAAMMMIVAVAVGYGDGGGDDGGLWCSFFGAAYGAGQSVSLCNGKRPRLNVSSLQVPAKSLGRAVAAYASTSSFNVTKATIAGDTLVDAGQTMWCNEKRLPTAFRTGNLT